MVRGRVAKVEWQPSVLEELAHSLVHRHGLGRAAVVLCIVALRPLQEVLVGNTRDGKDEAEHVEEAQARGLDGHHCRVPWEARGDARVQAGEDTEDQRHKHRRTALLVDLQPSLLREALASRRGLHRAHGSEDARRHDEVPMPQRAAVHQLRQGLPLLQQAVGVEADEGNRSIRELETQILCQLRPRLGLRTAALRALRARLRAVVDTLGGDELANEHVLVPAHSSLLRVLEELELLRRIHACVRQQQLVPAGVAAEQRGQVVDLVVQDHVRLGARRPARRPLVLRHLRSREEGKLATLCHDLCELGEARLLRRLRGLGGNATVPTRLCRLDILLRGAFEPA
mmetsp:Transcript_106076/g.295375  ORF Transcript_106076/g.295375 Transcript_106076/m.295375 type:complete len:342 (-) Transcript_106076:106-1131(-)